MVFCFFMSIIVHYIFNVLFICSIWHHLPSLMYSDFPWNADGAKWSLQGILPCFFLLNCMSQIAVLLRLWSSLEQLSKVHLSVSIRDVNTAIMELLIMAYALKTSCAKNIIGVIPYFPYSKQCKMRKRGSIVCKLLASMLARAGNGCHVPASVFTVTVKNVDTTISLLLLWLTAFS